MDNFAVQRLVQFVEELLDANIHDARDRMQFRRALHERLDRMEDTILTAIGKKDDAQDEHQHSIVINTGSPQGLPSYAKKALITWVVRGLQYLAPAIVTGYEIFKHVLRH